MAFVLLLLPLNGLIRLVAAHLNGLRNLAAAQLAEFALTPSFALVVALGLLVAGLGGLRPQDAILVQIAAAGATLAIAGVWLLRARREGQGVVARPVGQIGLLKQGSPFLLLNLGT